MSPDGTRPRSDVPLVDLSSGVFAGWVDGKGGCFPVVNGTISCQTPFTRPGIPDQVDAGGLGTLVITSEGEVIGVGVRGDGESPRTCFLFRIGQRGATYEEHGPYNWVGAGKHRIVVGPSGALAYEANLPDGKPIVWINGAMYDKAQVVKYALHPTSGRSALLLMEPEEPDRAVGNCPMMRLFLGGERTSHLFAAPPERVPECSRIVWDPNSERLGVATCADQLFLVRGSEEGESRMLDNALSAWELTFVGDRLLVSGTQVERGDVDRKGRVPVASGIFEFPL